MYRIQQRYFFHEFITSQIIFPSLRLLYLWSSNETFGCIGFTRGNTSWSSLHPKGPSPTLWRYFNFQRYFNFPLLQEAWSCIGFTRGNTSWSSLHPKGPSSPIRSTGKFRSDISWSCRIHGRYFLSLRVLYLTELEWAPFGCIGFTRGNTSWSSLHPKGHSLLWYVQLPSSSEGLHLHWIHQRYFFH